jgi:anti-sigma factor RsiW
LIEYEEHPVDYLPELALGVLPDGDAVTVRDHLAGCETCAAEFEEMSRVTALLPLAVEEHEPSAALKANLMDRIATEPTVLRSREPATRRSMPASFRRYALVATAAAVVLLIAGGLGGFLLRGGSSSGDELRAETDRQQELLQAVAQGQAETSEASVNGVRASVVRSPSSDWAYAVVDGMPALPSGKAYQAWFTRDGTQFEPSDLFSVSQGGVWLHANGPLSGYTALAFTVEDDAGAAAPTQAPFALVPLQKAAMR